MFLEMFQEIWEKYRIQIIIGILGVGIMACLFLPGIGKADSDNQLEFSKTSTNYRKSESFSPETVNSTSVIKSENRIYVDIKGAVCHPGAYQMKADQRIGDVINAAGGYLKDADSDQVNLAQKINDQMVIYIPKKGEKIPIFNFNSEKNSNENVNSSQNVSTNSGGKVNLNTATVEQLKGLTGIGEKKAQKIIEYRQEHGQFKSVDELKNVNGFGEKSIATLAEQVCV